MCITCTHRVYYHTRSSSITIREARVLPYTRLEYYHTRGSSITIHEARVLPYTRLEYYHTRDASITIRATRVRSYVSGRHVCLPYIDECPAGRRSCKILTLFPRVSLNLFMLAVSNSVCSQRNDKAQAGIMMNDNYMTTE